MTAYTPPKAATKLDQLIDVRNHAAETGERELDVTWHDGSTSRVSLGPLLQIKDYRKLLDEWADEVLTLNKKEVRSDEF